MHPKKMSINFKGKFYGYPIMSKHSNVEDISYILELSDDPYVDVNEEFIDDLGILGYGKEGQDDGCSRLRGEKTTSKLEF